MKLLVVADEEEPCFYDYYRPGCLDEFDLIISCGDLHREYLEFLVTMARCPLLYVHGNHDDAYDQEPPEGCICIENEIYEYQGLRFFGLGGSYRYRPDGNHMYTEREMQFRILRQKLRLIRTGGFDVLVTHAPAYHLGDLDTIPHRGFQCFVKLLDEYRPKYMLHGHIHRNYGRKIPRINQYKNTTIINAFHHYVIEV